MKIKELIKNLEEIFEVEGNIEVGEASMYYFCYSKITGPYIRNSTRDDDPELGDRFVTL